ncbi:Oxidored-FMN domain-containing protein [Mycena kentingensis (nom. inval.)]|nr:Oxidored-FMN domain-containing protein [Mycena kentingensis (nom. inval.)]
MAATPQSKLFTPLAVNDNVQLQHRIVLAPLTRYKADDAHVPFYPLVKEYYSQRASTPGTLLITEGTFIAVKAGGYAHVPGIWSDAQIAAWKEISASVHAKGSFIFMQLWALGRAADYAQLQKEDPSAPYISASDVPYSARASQGSPSPRPMTVDEIKEYPQLYAQAAKNAIEAGFDGVEVHSANGYLPDQFLQPVTNKRTDAYGGSIENRSRFVLEVVDAIVNAVGAHRTAIRFSPWGNFAGASSLPPMYHSTDHLARQKWACPTPSHNSRMSSPPSRMRTPPRRSHICISSSHARPRVQGNVTRDPTTVGVHESNDALRAVWRSATASTGKRIVLLAGGFTKEIAEKTLKIEKEEEGERIATVFGRWFIANPDLPVRLRDDIPLNEYDRKTFYLLGENSPRGYTDQPFATTRNARF